MTKEQKIKESFGESWNLLTYSMQQHILTVHHWVDRSRNRMDLSPKDLGFDEDTECEVHCEFWRPIQLKGIEDNNGWTKIESMDSFPQEIIFCITCIYLDGTAYQVGTSRNRTPDDLLRMWQAAELTHFKQIEINPPIF